MDSADAQRAIHSRVAYNWTETPLCYANDGYQPPSTINEWVRVTVAQGTASASAIGRAIVGGPGAVRHPGNIIVQIFVRPDTGTTRAKELAALVTQIFQHETFDGVRCFETSVITVGEFRGWWQTNVTTAFFFDERKAA